LHYSALPGPAALGITLKCGADWEKWSSIPAVPVTGHTTMQNSLFLPQRCQKQSQLLVALAHRWMTTLSEPLGLSGKVYPQMVITNPSANRGRRSLT